MDKIIDTIKYFNYKKIIFPVFVIAIYILGFLYFEYKIDSINVIEKETVYIEKEDIPVAEEVVELDEIKYIFVDIKGAIKNPGVYKLEEGSRVVDQTTTNMIQRISYLFAINPLISKEI